MKKLSVVVCIFILCVLNTFADDDFSVSINSLSVNAGIDIGKFEAELSADFGLSKSTIESFRVETGMSAGDLYVALELSRISGKPLDAVSTAYKSNKSKGWGFIAQSMGIKPGSQEFKLLKQRLDAKAEKHKKPAPGKNKKG